DAEHPLPQRLEDQRVGPRARPPGAPGAELKGAVVRLALRANGEIGRGGKAEVADRAPGDLELDGEGHPVVQADLVAVDPRGEAYVYLGPREPGSQKGPEQERQRA